MDTKKPSNIIISQGDNQNIGPISCMYFFFSFYVHRQNYTMRELLFPVHDYLIRTLQISTNKKAGDCVDNLYLDTTLLQPLLHPRL
jgi:hypothetical protein